MATESRPLVNKYESPSTNYLYPNQLITEEEKFANKGKYFYDMIQWICSFYNRPLNQNMLPQELQEDDAYSPVINMIRYMQYYLGKQPNLNYKYLTQDVTGTNLQPTWRKGQDISPLVDNVVGNFRKSLANVNFSCNPLSEKAYSEKMNVTNKVMLKFELKKQMKQLEDMGIKFGPANGKDFESRDAIKKWLNDGSGGYKAFGAQMATDMATDIWNTDYSLNKFLQTGQHGTICGVGGIEHVVENGKYTMEVVMPYQAITDLRFDDDFNRRAQFAGVIRNLNTGDIFSRWHWLPNDIKKEIQEMATDNKMFGAYNTAKNFQWWTPSNTYGSATVSCVTAYWFTTRDMDVRTVVNKYGVLALEEIKDRKKVISEAKRKLSTKKIDQPEYDDICNRLTGDFIIKDIYKATVIGNKYLVDYGYFNNVSTNPFTHDSMLPIQFWMPNMMAGQIRSIVARLHAIQDEIDAYRFMIKESLGKSIGKVWAVTKAMGNNTTIAEIIKDFKQFGGTVLMLENGEVDEREKSARKFIDTIDLSTDQNLMTFYNVIAGLKEEMKEIISTSKIAMGQQTSYIGATTQTQSTNLTTLGQANIQEGFIEFVANNMQYGLNVKKNLFANFPNRMDTMVNIGDEGVRYLDTTLTEQLKFEDFLLYVHIKDIIGDAARDRIIQQAQAWAQNPAYGITPADSLKVEKATTFTEAITILEESFRRSEAKADKQNEMQSKIQQIQMEQQQQAQMFAEEQKRIADLITKLTEIDREGYWNARVAEIKEKMKVPNLAMEQAPPMPQAAQQPQAAPAGAPSGVPAQV